MKTALPAAWFVAVIIVGPLHAQVAIPATPKKFTTRGAGASINTNAGATLLAPKSPSSSPIVRHITHLVLSETRQWQSSDGKSLLGKLIAFEDIPQTQNTATAATVTPPANPTVVLDGKARFLVGTRAYEIPLQRLSQADRDLVERIRVAVANAPTPSLQPPLPAK